MPQAQYEILIPKQDTLGQPIQDLAPHALSHITQQLQVTKAHVEPTRQVHMMGRPELFDPLVFVAEDSPIADSTAKQLASYVGEVANQDVVLVTKSGGKSGIQTWPVRNNNHIPGQPSEASKLPMAMNNL
jgi:hypothetical protein